MMRFVRIFAGFTAEGRRTGVEPLNLVMQHHLSDILRCVAVCKIVIYTKTGGLESKSCLHVSSAT